MTVSESRRAFLKATAAASTAAAAGLTLPLDAAAQQAGNAGIRCDKAPCRFCGTGCSVLVGTKDGHVVATQGDPDAPGYLEEYNHVVQKLAAQPHQGPIDVAGIKSFLGTQSE